MVLARGLFSSPPSRDLQVKLDVTLGDLTKIGKSQKFTLSVDVEGGRLVLLRRQRDSQEDWTTFTHDRSEPGPDLGRGGGGGRAGQPPGLSARASVTGLHPLVRQLIKSQRVQNKLGVVFEKEKDRTQRKDFIFVSARVSSVLGWPPAGVPGGRKERKCVMQVTRPS